jgi:putative nucleotidyltransferase with HDIG domain
MSLEPSLAEQELLADTFQRAGSPLSTRELLAELVLGVGFAGTVAGLWLARAPHGFAVGPAVLCVLVLALATLVQFDTPFGFTVPTQLAFVPMLFAVPVSLVPVAVAVALSIARLPDVLSRRVPPDRLLKAPRNSWFAIGPVAVFVLAGTDPASAGAWLLLAALLAEFVLDFIVSGVEFAIAREASLAEQLRDSWVYGIDAALSGVGLVVAKQMPSTPAAVVSLVPLLGLFALFAHERRRRLEGMLELGNAYRGTALVLGDVVEADDNYTGEHCRSVVALALAVGEELGLGATQRRNLEFAALLHDVGKIAIPKEIINKPGKLDPREWTIIKTHTVEGQKMLERVGGFMRDVGLIVRSHHERWDGSGYPDGAAGEGIPLEARIIACCDTWNAMRTDRSYRTALSYEVALAELTSNAGTQLDPSTVDALVRVIEPSAEPESSTTNADELRPTVTARAVRRPDPLTP